MRRPGAEQIATVVVCTADAPSLAAICDHLIERRFAPLPATSASAASCLCRYGRADVLILDLALPGDSALDLLQERSDSQHFPDLGVLVLVDESGPPEVLGDDPVPAVDDFLRRPFGLDEVTHRLLTILRRRHGRLDSPVQVGELLVDPGRRKVTVGDREVRLARKEFVLLRVLASDPTRVFSKEELLRDVWGVSGPAAKARTLDSHASRLRRKLDPEGRRFIVNCWGVGYRLVDLLDDVAPTTDKGGASR
jgi:DNA-binding response OmpR family regulator